MKFTKAEILDLCQPTENYHNSLEEAYHFCKKLALGHYENFPVASALLPYKLRQCIFPIYTFSRLADDIADEDYGFNTDAKLQLLDDLLEQAIDSTKYKSKLGIALIDTISKNNLDLNIFKRLIIAFKYDSDFKRFETLDELYWYCTHSANPIGEVLLALTGNLNEENLKLSDKICTALQLINFMQDLSIDLNNNRFNIPIDLYPNQIKQEYLLENSQERIIFEYAVKCINELSLKLLDEGSILPHNVKGIRFSKELGFIVQSGYAIHRKISDTKANLIMHRPKLNKFDFLLSFIKTFAH